MTVTGQNDDIDSPTLRTATIRHAVSGGDYDDFDLTGSNVSVTIQDDDVPGLSLTKTTVSVAETGGEAEYTVKLNTAPTGTVIVGIYSGNTSVANVSPATLSFDTDNWSTEQTVTVTGVNDDIDNPSDRTATITHDATGADYGSIPDRSVTVTATDDDVHGVTVSETEVSVAENGGTATYAVVLTSEPTHQVRVSPSSSATDAATVSPTG